MDRKSRLTTWALGHFRPSAPRAAGVNLFRTLVQTAVFWTLFLACLPLAIRLFEQAIGVTPFAFPTQVWLPWLAFAACGVLGLSSGVTMSLVGCGTPLPPDCPNRLVVAGPYRFVRNPMAVAGIAQGVCVGLALGSLLTVLYALLGALLWHFLVRPIEEEDLRRRFAGEFEHYRDHVGCWVPRLTPYRPPR